MRTKVLLGAAVVLMLAISVATIGSNMGFKISIAIPANQQKIVSLPYYNNFTDATSLYNDLVASGGTSVSVLNYTGTAWQNWSGGGFGQVNFAITSGLAYMVVSTTAFNWIVVGSHNPSLGVATTANLQNLISVPYHATATDAATLYTQLVAAGATGLSVLNYTGTAWQNWSGGGFGQVNFPLVPGTGVMVVSTAAFAWTPAHY